MPDAGDIAYYSSNGAVLTNGFNSTVPSSYSTFYAGKLLTDYSSATANQFMGTHGGLVLRGGGHAATNYNATAGLVTKGDTIEFVQLSEPTNWFPTRPVDNDLAPAANDTSHVDQTWGDALPSIDTQPRPASPHSYVTGTVVPPSRGGAAHGTFFEVMTGAPGYSGQLANTSAPGSHLLPLASDTGTAGNVWARTGAAPLAGNASWGGATAAAYVAAQHRTYYSARIAGPSMRWFDHATGTHHIGTGANVIDGSGSDPDSAAMFEAPSRGLLIGVDRAGGQLRLKYAETALPEPAARSATFSTPLWAGPAGEAWTQAFWWALNGKIYIGNVLASSGGAYDRSAIFEVTIPARLSDPWPVRRVLLPNGKTFLTGNVWQRLCPLPAARAVLQLSHDHTSGVSQLMVWRPPE